MLFRSENTERERIRDKSKKALRNCEMMEREEIEREREREDERKRESGQVKKRWYRLSDSKTERGTREKERKAPNQYLCCGAKQFESHN